MPGARDGTEHFIDFHLNIVVFRNGIGARDALDDDRESETDEDERGQASEIDAGPNAGDGRCTDRNIFDNRARLRLRPGRIPHRPRHPLIAEKHDGERGKADEQQRMPRVFSRPDAQSGEEHGDGSRVPESTSRPHRAHRRGSHRRRSSTGETQLITRSTPAAAGM